MEEEFRQWLKQKYTPLTADQYFRSISKISKHYSEQENIPTNVYEINDITQISKIVEKYSKAGVYAKFGDISNGTIRNAIARYSEFFTNRNLVEYSPDETDVELSYTKQINFSYERDLQTTLCSQISELFPEFRIFGVEYPIGRRRIDVLLEHKKNKDLLVVELKSGVADYKVFGQISMYIGLLKEQFPDKAITGVIVAGSIDESLQQACSITSLIKLKMYRMSLELEEI